MILDWVSDWQAWAEAIVTSFSAIGTWEFLKWRQRKGKERHDE